VEEGLPAVEEELAVLERRVACCGKSRWEIKV